MDILFNILSANFEQTRHNMISAISRQKYSVEIDKLISIGYISEVDYANVHTLVNPSFDSTPRHIKLFNGKCLSEADLERLVINYNKGRFNLDVNSKNRFYWTNDGNLYHNENGPAIEHLDGKEEFWLNGHQYSSKEECETKLGQTKSKNELPDLVTDMNNKILKRLEDVEKTLDNVKKTVGTVPSDDNQPTTLPSISYPLQQFLSHPEIGISKKESDKAFLCDSFIADLTVALPRAVDNAQLFWYWMSYNPNYGRRNLEEWIKEIYKLSDDQVKEKIAVFRKDDKYQIPKAYETNNIITDQFNKQWEAMVKETNAYRAPKIKEFFSKAELEKLKQELNNWGKTFQDAGFTVYAMDNKGELQELPKIAEKDTSSQFTQELVSAGYRVASTQVSQAIKKIILTQLPPEKIPALTSLLNSEMGTALVSILAGLALTYSFKDNKKVQKLAQEFRINSLSTFGNLAVEELMETIINSLQHSVTVIPENNEVLDVSALQEENPPVEETKELNILN